MVWCATGMHITRSVLGHALRVIEYQWRGTRSAWFMRYG
jgi:hypothetical protein